MAPHQHLLQPVAAPQQRPGGALHSLGAHGLDLEPKIRGFSRCFRPETHGKIMENLELIPFKVDFCSAEVDDSWCIQLVDGDYKWKIV